MKVAFTRQRLANRVSQLGRTISKDYKGRSLDVVIVLESSFLFAADLVRQISRPVVCHFVRSELRDIRMGGHPRREVFFSSAPSLTGPRRSRGGCRAKHGRYAGLFDEAARRDQAAHFATWLSSSIRQPLEKLI